MAPWRRESENRWRRQIREASTSLLAARSRHELMDAVAEIEALKSSLDALELAIVRELDATQAVKELGWASTQDFVTSLAGGTKATGPAVVRLANAVDEPVMAPVGEALADGWLSTAKAHVIDRAVDTLPGDRALRQRAVRAMLDEAKALDATERGRSPTGSSASSTPTATSAGTSRPWTGRSASPTSAGTSRSPRTGPAARGSGDGAAARTPP